MCRHSVRVTRRVAAAGGRRPSHATK
jgi:hypothetical protein